MTDRRQRWTFNRLVGQTNFPFIGWPLGRDNWMLVAKVRPRVKLNGATFKRERAPENRFRRNARVARCGRLTGRPAQDKSTRKSVVIEEAGEESRTPSHMVHDTGAKRVRYSSSFQPRKIASHLIKRR